MIDFHLNTPSTILCKNSWEMIAKLVALLVSTVRMPQSNWCQLLDWNIFKYSKCYWAVDCCSTALNWLITSNVSLCDHVGEHIWFTHSLQKVISPWKVCFCYHISTALRTASQCVHCALTANELLLVDICDSCHSFGFMPHGKAKELLLEDSLGINGLGKFPIHTGIY